MKDSKNSLDFTPSENKTRKRWLFWFTLLPSFLFGLLIVGYIFSSFGSLGVSTVIWGMITLLLIIAGSYTNYYCAYKNPGTVLLLLEMIGNSLYLLSAFFKITGHLISPEKDFPAITIILLLFNAINFYYSYKLRKINKQMQKRRLESSPVYTQAISLFSTATNLEELNKQFSELRGDDASGSSITVLVKAYDEQKKLLS